MTSVQTEGATRRKPLRVWPGVVAVALLWWIRFAVPMIFPEALLFGVLGELVGALAVLVWWFFFSRAALLERAGAIVLILAALFGTSRLVHESIAGGMMGNMLVIYSIPVLSLALVAWAVATRHLSERLRRVSLVATILLACGAFTLIRTGGIYGSSGSDLHWRWSKTPEQRLLAYARDEPTMTADTRGVEWAGFRGPNRDGVIRGVRIETDWSRSPPVELWRRSIGPGWSSFAVSGNVFYTQEQRGNDELVACYNMTNGLPVWRHRDAVRFWESNAGPGPRATPTLSHGRVYSFGATGILNALDAANGAIVWSRNVASDSETKLPGWGFSSSPLVIDDVVIVGAAGKLVGYDIGTGKLRWSGPGHGGSYSSPHRFSADGITQVLLLSDAGLTSVAPANGTVLWEHAWPGVTIVQPTVIGNGDLLTTTAGATGGLGLRRLLIAHKAAAWSVEPRWTSPGLKPYFNDLVMHKGCAYGFDGSILACISLEDGVRKWKGGRYGNGQLVVLADQDVLMVLSEQGELALVTASPDQFKEIARFSAIKGKTWNHPVVVGNVVLVRNGEEMAAFRLSPANG